MVPESIYPNNSLNLPSIPALSSSDLDNSLGTPDINNKSAGSESVSINFDSAIKSDSVGTLNGIDKDVDNSVAEFILGTEKIDLLPNTPATSSQDFNNAEVDSGEVLPETQPLKTPTIPDNYSKLNTFGGTDYLNVSQSGKAEIESGYYEALSKGELAIFSLEGMDKLKAGSVEFIAEAARRATSNSHLGYVVISEAMEEHNFSASAGEKTNGKYGESKGIKTYFMPAGSQFGVMFVPNGTVGEVLVNPEIEGGKHPLFGRQIIEYLNTSYLESTILEGVSIAEGHSMEIMPAELSKTGPEAVGEISQKTETSNAQKVPMRDNLEETTKAEFQSINDSPVIPNSEIICEKNDSNRTGGNSKLKPTENVDLSEKSALPCNASPKDLQFSTQKFYKRGDVFQLTGKVFDLNGADDIETLKISISKQMKNGKWKTIEVTELTTFKKEEEENEWANFYYELGDLEPGKYQVKLIARDEAGAVSNHAINDFTFLSSSETNNLTDNVLFAIDNATHLDSYNPEELAETKQWLVSVQEGESASDLAALIGATNLGETGLIPNTYIFEFPTDIEPTAIISELESQLEVEYFYPLTWFNLKTYIPPSTFNTNDPLVSEQWHLNNTGQTGGTIGADVNEFPALNISLPGNLTQTVSGANINLGIVDDGVQQSHPDILQRYLDNLSHNFNIEIPNAPQSLNATQIPIAPRRSDEIGLETVQDITLDNMQVMLRTKPSDGTSVNLTGEMSIEDLQIWWRTPRSDEDSVTGINDPKSPIIGEINYGIEQLQVAIRTSRSEENSGNPTTEISQYLEELQVWWRTPRSDEEKVNLKELEEGNDLVLAMLGFNGLEELQVLTRTPRSDDGSQRNPDNSVTNDMAVIAVSGSINSLESLQVRLQNPPSEEIADLTKIASDEEAATVIENRLQKVFESWEILSAQNVNNIEGLQVPVRTKRSEGNTENLSVFTGTDTASIVSEILQNNPAEIWVYGKPKNGDADSVVLISGKDPAAVADSILKYDLAEIAVWWNRAPNPQPIDDISTVFDRVWTGGNADQESVRSGETFVELGTILGRENLEKLWERWNDDNSGSATNFPNRHGTSVAGVAAASDNETGIMGAAYEAGIANVQLLGDNLVTDQQIADALTYQNQAIDVYNNSWKPGDPFVSSPLVNWAFETNVNDGRNGLGNITVFAGGNDGWDGENVNYNSFANSRNTIAVAAIDHNGEQSWYSEPGASLLISAYSSGDGVGITTTATSKEGNSAYTDTFGGTSSAAPLVSGVVALMLQANPNLTQRDVQHILVETADKNDANDENWVVNAAGYDVNYKYGFGGINAEAAVKTAISWNGVSPEIEVESPVQHVGISIPDNNSSGVVSEINIARDIKVEWAEVMVDIDHSWRGDLEVKLISPNGTESILAEPHYDPEDGYNKWVFTSNRNWGESSLGDWKLEVSDRLSGEAGTLNNWKLNLYGTEQPTNQLQNIVNITTTDADAGEDGNTGTFTITRTGDTTGTLTVNYAVAGKAKFGNDYLGLTGSVTFGAGVTSIPLNVIPLDDNLDEEDEILEVIIGANSAYKVGTNNIASLTIKDNDDPTITITATDANATEDGNAAQFVVTRTGPDFSNSITVHYSVAGTATNGTDYRQLTGTVTIPAGMSSATIPVNPIFDYNAEGNETVTLNLIDTSFYDLGATTSATATITDSTTTDWYGPFVYENPANGHLYILSQLDTWLGAQNQAEILGGNLVTVNDAAENNWLINTFGGNQRFWIGLTDSEIYGATEGNFKWVNGEPISYTNWYPGQPDNTMFTPLAEDYSEMNVLTPGSWYDSPSDWTGIDNSVKIRPGIIEIDPATLTKPIVNFMVTDSQAGENGNAGQLIISRVGKLDEALTVNYTVAGSATNGSDYQQLTGTVTIPAGSSLVTIPIIALNDNDVEGNEQIVVNLAAGNYQIGNKPVAQVTIVDEDPINKIYREVGGREGEPSGIEFHQNILNLGGTLAEIRWGMAHEPIFQEAANQIKHIYRDTLGRDATEQEISYWQDSLGNGATLSEIRHQLDGKEFINITYPIYTNPETGHRYFLTTPDTWLGAYEQAKAAGGNLVTINDRNEQEWLFNTLGNSGWIGLTDSPMFGATEGNYQWVNGEPVNYINWWSTGPNNNLHTPEGEDFTETSLSSIDQAWNDMPSSQNWLRQGIVEIPSKPTATNLNTTQTYTEETPLNLTDIVVTDPDHQTTVTLTLSNPNSGTLNTGTAGSVTSTFNNGIWTATGTVSDVNTLLANLQFTPAPNFNQNVSINVAITDDIAAPLTGTINLQGVPVNDTPTLNPSLSLTNATESAPYIITYESLLSATNATDPDGDTLTFRIESVGADIPTKNGQPVVAGVTTLSPGESLVWTPTTAGTQMPAFSVSVSDGVGANAQWLPVSVPIAIDVFKPVVSITASDPNATEGGDSGEFTITRTGDTTNPLTVNYGIDNNGFWSYPVATNGSDYETLSGTITIPAGASSVKIPINVIDDNLIEWSERVKLFVAGTDNYQVGNNANAEVKIWDNETPRLELYDDEQLGRYDGVEGGVSARFLVRRVGSLLEPLTVNYSVAGTATPGTDYTAVGFNESTQTGTITIPAGQYDAYIQFNAIDDTEEETVETIDVTFTPNPNYTILAGYGTGIVNIHDNENKPIFNISTTDFTATEGSDNGQFTITRTGDLSQTVTLKYNVSSDWSNPTTNDGTDYEFVPNSITFAPNQTTATITINPIDDNIAEVTESVVINLLRDAAYMVGDSSVGRFLIYDNERPEVEWKQQLGTTADDTINALAINNGNLSFATNGELIGTGADDNIDIAFDNFGNRYSLSKGESLTYLSKYNSAGGVEWQQSFGVNSEMTKLAVNPDGSVYITGSTTDNLDGINAGKLDAFLAKFDSAGTQEWVKQIGTPDDEKSTAIAIDNQGNVYITGTTKGGLGGTREGDGDAWVAKYNSSGSLQWTEQIGSIAEDTSYGIATDNNGHIYVAGKTYGWLGENYTGGPRNWVGDATARYEAIIGNSYGLGGLYYGNGDAWVAQLSTDGELNWKRLLGTTGEDSANSIVADSTGVYLTGTTTGKLGDTQFGGQDIFYAKYNVAGALEWKQQLGTTADDVANDIVLDGTALIIAGETSGNLDGTNEGGKDGFVIKLS